MARIREYQKETGIDKTCRDQALKPKLKDEALRLLAQPGTAAAAVARHQGLLYQTYISCTGYRERTKAATSLKHDKTSRYTRLDVYNENFVKKKARKTVADYPVAGFLYTIIELRHGYKARATKGAAPGVRAPGGAAVLRCNAKCIEACVCILHSGACI